MTADYELELTTNGSKEENEQILEILKKYSNHKESPAYFNFIQVNENYLDRLETIPEGEMKISGSGPWGYYTDISDVMLFHDIAKAVKNCEFDGEIFGTDDYGEGIFTAQYHDGIYSTEYDYICLEDMYEDWKDGFIQKYPLEKFTALYKLSDSFTDEDYDNYICNLIYEHNGDIDNLAYEDFLEEMLSFGVSTELTEEEFNQIEINYPNTDDYKDEWGTPFYETINMLEGEKER